MGYPVMKGVQRKRKEGQKVRSRARKENDASVFVRTARRREERTYNHL